MGPVSRGTVRGWSLLKMCPLFFDIIHLSPSSSLNILCWIAEKLETSYLFLLNRSFHRTCQFFSLSFYIRALFGLIQSMHLMLQGSNHTGLFDSRVKALHLISSLTDSSLTALLDLSTGYLHLFRGQAAHILFYIPISIQSRSLS